MGSTGRPNLVHYAIGDSVWPAPSRMLREAPPAAGPTGTVGRARATQELHGAVRSGTAGCGLNRDYGPCTGRGGSYASTHAHLSTAGRETLWGPRAASWPEELRDSERNYSSTHAYLGIAAAGPARGQWAASGPEKLRDSEWSRMSVTDVDVTQRPFVFNIFFCRSRSVMTQCPILNLLCSIQN